MSEKLLPCPFCGGEAKVQINTEMGGSQYQVLCTECPVTVGRYWYWNKKDAIKAWNTRKPMEQIVEKLDEALEILAQLAEQYKYSKSKYDQGKKFAYENAVSFVKEYVHE